MGRVVYDVPLVVQQQSPICWVACMAMVASFKLNRSIGVGQYMNGLEPNSSSIPNPTQSWDDHYRRLSINGFTSVAINPSSGEIESVLQRCGPFILSHQCVGFPYGAGWTPPTSGGHAVVITGIDSAINGGTCWMNNPWGNKDRAILTSAVMTAITQQQTSANNIMPVAYFQSSS